MAHLNLKYSLQDWQDTTHNWGEGKTKISQIGYSAWKILLLCMSYSFPMEIQICGLLLVTAQNVSWKWWQNAFFFRKICIQILALVFKKIISKIIISKPKYWCGKMIHVWWGSSHFLWIDFLLKLFFSPYNLYCEERNARKLPFGQNLIILKFEADQVIFFSPPNTSLGSSIQKSYNIRGAKNPSKKAQFGINFQKTKNFFLCFFSIILFSFHTKTPWSHYHFEKIWSKVYPSQSQKTIFAWTLLW